MFFLNQNRDAKDRGYFSCKLNRCDFPFKTKLQKWERWSSFIILMCLPCPQAKKKHIRSKATGKGLFKSYIFYQFKNFKYCVVLIILTRQSIYMTHVWMLILDQNICRVLGYVRLYYLPRKPQNQCHYENCKFVDWKYNVEINAT